MATRHIVFPRSRLTQINLRSSAKSADDPPPCGTNVFVDWNWGGFSAFLDICEIQVDRGDGKGFVALAFDTTPGYVDTQPFPAAPVKWTYQAIYRVGDSRIGQWSKPVSVTVGG